MNDVQTEQFNFLEKGTMRSLMNHICASRILGASASNSVGYWQPAPNGCRQDIMCRSVLISRLWTLGQRQITPRIEGYTPIDAREFQRQ